MAMRVVDMMLGAGAGGLEAVSFKRWRRYYGSIPKKLPWLLRQLAWLVDRPLVFCE